MTFSLTGGWFVKVHGWLLEADMGGEALQKASPCSLPGTGVTLSLLSTHKNVCLRLLPGQRVNNHIAKSTELLSRVLTSFERCQLPLILTQVGPGWTGRGGGETGGGGRRAASRGSGRAASASGECSEAGRSMFSQWKKETSKMIWKLLPGHC